MQPISLCLMFGGKSTEYEVSLMSVCSVLENIDRSRYALTLLGVTPGGTMLFYGGGVDDIRADHWAAHPSCRRAAFAPEYGSRKLLLFDGDRIAEERVLDCVFPVMHGTLCEDGRLQGMLEFCGMPFVGSGCASSAVAMDKSFTKQILNANGIRQAACAILTRDDLASDTEAALARAEAVAPYPLFVKPANAGSSVGVSKAKNKEALRDALFEAARFDEKILVEEAICGKEVECAVSGRGRDAFAVMPGEIEPGAEFYDYKDKYYGGVSRAYIPARIEPQTAERLKQLAVRIYRLLGCRDLSRVDFFVRKTADGGEEVVFNEINTLPGFTAISMYPKLRMYDGISYRALIDSLIDGAVSDRDAEGGAACER